MKLSQFVESVSVIFPNENCCYADSGVTSYVFGNRNGFVPRPLVEWDPHNIILSDDYVVLAYQCGEVQIPFDNANIILSNTLLISEIGYNLLSVVNLAYKGILSSFGNTNVTFLPERNGMDIGHCATYPYNVLHLVLFAIVHQRAYIANEHPLNS